MSYFVHWVWLGKQMPAEILTKISEWVKKGRLAPEVQPILWVDGDVAASLELLPGSPSGDIASPRDTLARAPRVWVVDIDSSDMLDRVPAWGRLKTAVAWEKLDMDRSGLLQVSSDIVRIAALWLCGGAYWDLGDTSPGAWTFGDTRLRARAMRDAPAVIPQVLGQSRVENGIIITNPLKEDEARVVYGRILQWMEDKLRSGDERLKEINRVLLDWHTQLKNDCALGSHTSATKRALRDELEGGGTLYWRDLDEAMLRVLQGLPQDDLNVVKLLKATVKEDEAVYVQCLEDLFGRLVGQTLLPGLSLSVNRYTFTPFVTTLGQQILDSLSENASTGDLAFVAGQLYQRGWRHLEHCFGGNTKASSWYSWKTRPGRMLIDARSRMADVQVERKPDTKECALCLKVGLLNRHRCRRCGLRICDACSTTLAHRQPGREALLWTGRERVCLGCAAIIQKRAA